MEGCWPKGRGVRELALGPRQSPGKLLTILPSESFRVSIPWGSLSVRLFIHLFVHSTNFVYGSLSYAKHCTRCYRFNPEQNRVPTPTELPFQLGEINHS